MLKKKINIIKRDPDGYSAEGFFLPPKMGGIIIYEEDQPIQGIGAIEKRHQMGMLAFTDGWHLSIAPGTQSLVFFIVFFSLF